MSIASRSDRARAGGLGVALRLRVVDLDGSLPEQDCFASRLASGQAKIARARDLGPGLRVMTSRKEIARFSDRIYASFGEVDEAARDTEVYFYGSGDYHHLTAELIARTSEPVTVIHFDNHPDWCSFPSFSNCGGWVNRALALPNVERVITIGPCSADLVRPEFQTANLSAIANGRLEVFPWRAAPSRVWRRYPDTVCGSYVGGEIRWRNLADESWDGFLDELAHRLPETALWITIDKDVLSRDEATTNWDQGQMRLDQIIEALDRLAASRRIAGIDVCGEYSEPKYQHRIRAALASFDNPPRKPPGEAELAKNARGNARLLDSFERLLAPEVARAAMVNA